MNNTQIVYVVMSELNGYKNIHQVWNTEENAFAFIDQLQGILAWSEHHFYVLSMPVFPIPAP